MPTVTWDTTFEESPADTDEAKYGATKIRQLKVAVRERLELEMNFQAGTQPLGKAGKLAVIFLGTTAEIDALTGMTNGSLAWDTDLKVLKRYSGSAWDILDIAHSKLSGLYSGTGEISKVQVEAGGTGYTVNDVLTVADGTDGQVTVTSVNGGIVTGISLTAGGSGYTVGVHATTGGTGSGCTVKVTALVAPDDHPQYIKVDKEGQVLTENLAVTASKTVDGRDVSEDGAALDIMKVVSFATKVFAGDGSDGDVTISSDTTLPQGTNGIKVMQYNNLTVNAGFWLQAHLDDQVLVILVKNKLTLNGIIRMNSHGGAGGIWQLGPAPGSPGGAGSSGGGGGGGTALDNWGGGGGGGGQDGSANSGGGGTDRWDKGGGSKGKGGNGGGEGAGGGIGLRYIQSPFHPLKFEHFRTIIGAGGGGGGASYSGGSGGGGGAGGGCVWIEAKEIVWGASGKVTSNGTGGTPGGGSYPYAGGGGGGGAGGVIQIFVITKTGTATLEVNGGAGAAGGSGAGTGGNGASGITGEFIV